MTLIHRLAMPIALLFVQFPLLGAEVAVEGMTRKMTNLVFQLAIILFTAKIVGILFTKLKLPTVLGELTAGILIGPYMLGSIPFYGFENGVFPLVAGTSLPISPELYGIAALASIILLFLAGLETDLEMFLRFSFAGSIIGISGVVASFLFGSSVGIFFLHLDFMSPEILFLGVVSAATSVGITAKILSEKHSMDSPEGVTILAGAVIDDVLGIILLAIAGGVAATIMGSDKSVNWGDVGLIALKAVGVWLIFTFLGITFAHKISGLLKKFNDKTSISIIAFGLALFLAGIFEQAGLAMIIGAYVLGLSLSKTDLSYVIQETLQPVQALLVPVFFAVSGMMADVTLFLSKETLVLGLIYTLAAILAKFIGCGFPALFLGFNKLGATRIGLGMIPRGEVALIIAGIGLANGILDQKIFGVSIMMTLFTTIFAPPFLSLTLSNKKMGTNKEPVSGRTVKTEYLFDSEMITDALVRQIRDYFNKEGFYIYMMKTDHKIYQIRKEYVFIKLHHYRNRIVFITSQEDIQLVKTVTYEAFITIYNLVAQVRGKSFPEKFKKELLNSSIPRACCNLGSLLQPSRIKMELKSNTKEEAIKELVALFEDIDEAGKAEVAADIMERESIISTGMENGFAIPHIRSAKIDRARLAVGIKREGMDFGSIDDKKARVIVLLLSSDSAEDLHISILAALASMFYNAEETDKIVAAKTETEVWQIFNDFSNKHKNEAGKSSAFGFQFRKS